MAVNLVPDCWKENSSYWVGEQSLIVVYMQVE